MRGALRVVRRAGQLSRVRAVFLRGCAGLARLGEGERGDAVRNRRRKADGVVLSTRPKTCRIVTALPKPQAAATCSIASPVLSRRRCASRTRWARTQAAGAVPVASAVAPF